MRAFLTLITVIVVTTTLAADVSTSQRRRIEDAAAVLKEIHAVPDKDIPAELWNRAACVIVVPSLFTLFNLFFGIWSMVLASRGEFYRAGWYIFFAGVLDALDGRVARLSRTGTRFGGELDSQQLEMLPRIGPSVAQRILDYRKENGKFGSLEDLMLVRGIGESTFAQLKPYVALTGETTLQSKVKSSRTAANAKPAAGKAAPADDKPQG